jgi:hypothetical protein
VKRTTRKTLSCGATVAVAALVLTLAPGVASAEELDTTTTTVAVEQTAEPTLVVEEAPTPAEPTVIVEAPSEAHVSASIAPESANVAPLAAPGIPAPLISTDGLVSIGTGTYQPSPLAPAIPYDKYMPNLNAAHIEGYATPEGNAAPDEVPVDLRALVGRTVQGGSDIWTESGFRYSVDGALAARPDTGEQVNVPGFGDRIDMMEFTFDVTALPRTYIASNVDGQLRLIAFDQNSTYGVTVVLRHIATGTTSAPVTIVGKSGVDGASTFNWVSDAPEASHDGGVPMWSAAGEVEWRSGHFLKWPLPEETVMPTGARTVSPSEPRQAPGVAGGSTPAGFGLSDFGNGPEAGTPSYRVGALTGEPTKTISIDLARIPGVVGVAIPSAESGELVLDATGGLWSYNAPFVGLDYNAPEGLVIRASGSVVTFDFGSAEWLNAAGIVVPVLMADGTRDRAEVRTESLPRDVAGGLVEKRIPTETSLFISDIEMLEASRLTGLSPSLTEVQAAELPEGVSRVAGGFEYQGSASPTELSFGFTVSETVETEYGPVRPDSAAPGEVRIAVVEAAAPIDPPVTPEEPEVETPEVITPPRTQTPSEIRTERNGPRTDGNRPETDDGGFVAEQDAVMVGVQNGALGVLLLALGGALGWFIRGRKARPEVTDKA